MHRAYAGLGLIGVLVSSVATAQPGGATPDVAAPRADCPMPTRDPSLVAVSLDPRAANARRRPKALIVTEIQGLEALKAATPSTSPDRLQIVRRLAEDYDELIAVAASEPAVVAAARAKATQSFNDLLASPVYAKKDEVYFELGLEAESAHDFASARRSYYGLIQSQPSSPLVPVAYVKFGELFFDEGMTDPSKYELAVQAYQKATEFSNARPEVLDYAWFKLGHSLWRTGQATSAVRAFEHAASSASVAVPSSTLPGLPVHAAASLDLGELRQSCPALRR